MVSKLMKASEALGIYDFPSLKRHGKMVQLNNTDGRSVVVQADQIVYMRGKGNFGIYGDDRDLHRKSSGYNASSRTGKIGTGDHRHESDRHRRKADRSIYD